MNVISLESGAIVNSLLEHVKISTHAANHGTGKDAGFSAVANLLSLKKEGRKKWSYILVLSPYIETLVQFGNNGQLSGIV